MSHTDSSRLSAFARAAGLAAGMLLGVTSAFAEVCANTDDGTVCDITTNVAQVPASGVTFSNGTQTNYVKYTVTLTHYSNSAESFSQVKFAANADVAAPGAGAALVTTVSSPVTVPASTPTVSCPGLPAASVTCTFGFSPAFSTAGATITFDVTVQSPNVGTNTTGGTLNFTSTTSWLEPEGNWEGSPQRITAATALAVPDPKVVETFLPAAGTVKTGTTGGAATCVGGPAGNDPNKWVTIVKVPASADVGVDLNRPVTETIVPGAFGNYSRIAIPGQLFAVGTHWYDPDAASKLLVITLRRDNCTIDGRGPLTDALRILTEKVYYKPDATPANPAPQYTQLYLCFVTSGPTPGQPCIASLKVYTRFNSPSSDYWGDHEWVIYANENGKYQN